MQRPPDAMLKAIAILDSISLWSGRIVAWLIIPMVLSLVYEVVARYIFDAPTEWAYDMTFMLYGSFFMIGSAYTLYKKGHIRTDSYYGKWSPRTQGWVDTICYLVFFLPAADRVPRGRLGLLRALVHAGRADRHQPVDADRVPVQVRDSAGHAAAPAAGAVGIHEERMGCAQGGVALKPEYVGLLSLVMLFGAIFIGFPIAFTLIAVALGIGYSRSGRHRAAPHDAAVLLGHARSHARLGAVFPVHGLPARAVGPDGAPLSRRAAHARLAQRLALPGGADHRDDFRGRHRHRRLLGDAARRHGRAGDEAERLRRAHVGRDDRRRRHARHPDPALGDADRHGAGGRRAGHRPVRGGDLPGPAAVGPVHHLHAGAQLPQPEARPAPADGGPPAVRLCGQGSRARHAAGGHRDPRDAGRDPRGHRDAHRRGRGRRVRRVPAHADLPQADLGEDEDRGHVDARSVVHDPAAGRGVELFRRGVLAAWAAPR